MTKQIKILSLMIGAFLLSHCADGPNNRHVGFFSTNPNNGRQGLNDTAGENVSRFPILPQEILQALIGQNTNPIDLPQIDEPVATVGPIDWDALCKSYVGADDDKDGLSNDCEKELLKQKLPQYAGINPYAYNGWISGASFLDTQDKKFDLGADEQGKGSSDIFNRGGIGKNVTDQNTRFLEKFNAIKKSGRDVQAFSKIFNEYGSPISPDGNFLSYMRSDAFLEDNSYDASLAIIKGGDGIESVPYNKANSKSAPNLTAFEKNNGALRMIVYETNISIPDDKGLQVTVGTPSLGNALVTSPESGEYYLITNGSFSALQKDQLIAQGRKYLGGNFGTITKTPGCTTGKLDVVYLTKDWQAEPSTLRELVMIRESEKDLWRIPERGEIAIQPQGGVDCQKGLNKLSAKEGLSVFKTFLSSHASGVVDFNASLGKFITSADDFKEALKNKPISSMTEAQLVDLENGLKQLNLSDSEMKELTDQINARRLVSESKKLEVIKQDLAKSGLSKADLDALEARLVSINVSDAEKNAVRAKIKELRDAIDKQAAADAAAAKTAKEAKIITVSDKGPIELTYDDMDLLQNLGFEFQNEDGSPFKLDLTVARKRTSLEELSNVLNEFEKILNDPNASISSKIAIGEFIKTLSAKNQDKVKDNDLDNEAMNKLTEFMNKNGAKMPNLKGSDFGTEKIQVGDKIVTVTTIKFAPIQFSSGNTIDLNSQKKLVTIVDDIKRKIEPFAKNKKLYVLLKAYADPTGSRNVDQRKNENLALSQCRADAVKSFMNGVTVIESCNGTGKKTGKKYKAGTTQVTKIAVPIDATNINGVGVGEDENPTKTLKARKALRRVEIYLSDSDTILSVPHPTSSQLAPVTK